MASDEDDAGSDSAAGREGGDESELAGAPRLDMQFASAGDYYDITMCCW